MRVTEHNVSKEKGLNKCSGTYDEGEEERIKENILVLTKGRKSYECGTCSQQKDNFNTSQSTRTNNSTSTTTDMQQLTRRVAKYDRHFPTNKFVRSIKALMIEAHIDQ